MNVWHFVIACLYGITQGAAAGCLYNQVLECVYLKPPFKNQYQIMLEAVCDFEAIIT